MGQNRRTILRPITIDGVGLHSGAHTSVNLIPAPPGQGLVFRRIDLPERPWLGASIEAVIDLDRRTAIGNGAAMVGTVEHLLAAVYACGVDDLTVEVDGPELPIGDGSASAFFDELERVGTKQHDCRRSIWRVNRQLRVVEGDSEYVVAPNDRLTVSVTVEWDHPLIGRQSGCFDITPETFADSLARARTFGFMNESENLFSRGLAKGASESTVIVFTDTGIRGTELRWPDEVVRHKVVDLVGDLALLGLRIEADIVATKPNHRGNIALARIMDRTATVGEEQ